MGIPDEPFWSPPELVQAYREPCRGPRRRGPRRVDATRCADGPTTRPRGRPRGAAPARKDWDADLPDVRAGREDRHPRGDREGVQRRVDRLARPRLRRRRPHRQHRHQAHRPAADAVETPGGRQIHFGVREHAMGSTMVGMAEHGGDPARRRHVLRVPRLHAPAGAPGRAVTGAKVVFVFTHDSVGVGEDGPTHQPVEQLATLRAIPELQVIRPADANETVAAWQAAVAHDGPTAFVLSRQNITVVHRRLGRRARRRRRRRPGDDPQVVLVATGSEVAVCVDAADATRRRRARRAASSACRVGSLRGAGRDRTGTRVLPAGVPVLSVEAATRSAGRAAPTTRSASTASASAPPAPRCSTSSASTSTTSSARATRSIVDSVSEGRKPAWTVSPTCTTSSARARGSTT